MDQPPGKWMFLSSDGTEIQLPYVWSLSNYFEGKTRIEGRFVAEFDLREFLKGPTRGNLAIFLPSAGGIKSVKIQNELVFTFLGDSYYDVGPVIPIPEKLLQNLKIRVEIAISGFRHRYTGMLRGAPILGDLYNLQNFRDKSVVFHRNLPLVLASLDFLLGIFFIWLNSRLKDSDRFYLDHVFFLFCLGGFFLSLSGSIREISPLVGSVVHYSLNVTLSWSLARLVFRISKISKQKILFLDLIYLAIVIFSVISGFCHFVKTQVLMMIIARLGFIVSVFNLRKSKSSSSQKFVLFIFTLVSVFYLSDTLRLLFSLISWNYPMAFADRYTTPFTLLIPISFLASQFIQNLAESSRRKAFEELALQVAHDIRSPLAALEMVSQDFSQLSEETRVLSRGAVDRIKDISNVLLQEYRYNSNLNEEDQPVFDRSPEFLELLIESVVSEKRVQYRNRMGLKIYVKIESTAYGCFSKVNSREFKRVLSNLINNSAESISDFGTIVVSLEKIAASKLVHIVVRDTGGGVSKELLPQLFKKGNTKGKKEGSGLGLYHAKQMVDSWNGKISIEAHPDQGTIVRINLALCDPPSWFVPEIKLSENTEVIIVDDDQSIHQIWRDRLGSSVKKIEHFRMPEELIFWANKTVVSKNILILCDYELNHQMNGVELLSQVDYIGQSILVTGRFETQLVELAERYQLKLLPKRMAGFVPIEVN